MEGRKHPDALCEECPLYEGGRYVPSTGSGVEGIAVIGEAPGIQETRQGVPFVGPSGKLLKIVLEHHGIDPEEVFYTNATLCRPPDGKAPPQSAIRACRARLREEIDQSGVDQVVLLGNSAAESFLGRTGVTKLRVGPARRIDHRDVVATIHPAACLRQGDQFPFLVTDIGKLKAHVPPFVEPTYVVPDSVGDCLALLDAIDQRLGAGECAHNPEKVLVIDIEVDIEKDAGFDHPNQYGMLCVGIGYDRHKVVVLPEGLVVEEPVLRRLRELLAKYRLVCQNGKFDLAGLYPHLGGLKLYFDTMLASYVFDERPGIHGLKWQAKEYLGAPDYDSAVKQYVGPHDGYGAIPRDKLYRYNAYDVACTFSLYEMWLQRFAESEGRGLRKVHDFLVDASNELMYVELNGISVDKAVLRELDAEYLASLGRIEGSMAEVVPKNYDKRGGINPRSPMQVKAFLADNGIQTPSTDADHIDLILAQDKLPANEDTVRRFLQLLLEHRKVAKLHGTYVKGIAKRLYGGRIYPTFLLHGTTTGRLSCRNPNLQNIPRGSGIRKEFVASKPERVLIQTDYSQAELRVLSYLAGDAYFRDIFNAGVLDVFDELTPVLYPGMERSSMSKEEWKELRIRVKAFVYGLNYGRTEFSIAREYELPVRDAILLKKRFFEVIPEIVQFQEDVWNQVQRGEELVTPLGRHRRQTLITKENRDSTRNEALAFLPQSTASDMCLQAFIWTRQETKGFAWVRNLVHDSILIETHEDDVEEVKGIVEKNMIKAAEAVVGDYVKFAVDTTVGRSWGEL